MQTLVRNMLMINLLALIYSIVEKKSAQQLNPCACNNQSSAEK